MNKSPLMLIEPVKPIRSIPLQAIQVPMPMTITKDDAAMIAALGSLFVFWSLLMITHT